MSKGTVSSLSKILGQRLRSWKQSGWFILVEMVGGVLVLAGLFISYISLTQAINATDDARVVNAWSVLGMASPGNSGKVSAIRTLAQAGIALDGINVSCRRMTGAPDTSFVPEPIIEPIGRTGLLTGPPNERPGNCAPETFLRGLDLSNVSGPVSMVGADLSGTDLTGADMTDVNMSGSLLNNANMAEIVLSGTNLTHAVLRNVYGEPDLSGAIVTNADLTGAKLGSLELNWENGIPQTVAFSEIERLTLNYDIPAFMIHRDTGESGAISLNLGGADVYRLIAENAVLPLIDLSGTVIRGGSLEGARADYVQESLEPGVGYIRAHIADATFVGVSFRHADLSGITLDRVRCIGCEFAHADFTDAELIDFEVTSSTFCDRDGCATGLTPDHLLNMFTFHWSVEALGQSGHPSPSRWRDDYQIDMFHVESIDPTVNQPIQSLFEVGVDTTLTTCRNPDFDNRASEFVVREDWAAMDIDRLLVQCHR